MTCAWRVRGVARGATMQEAKRKPYDGDDDDDDDDCDDNAAAEDDDE